MDEQAEGRLDETPITECIPSKTRRSTVTMEDFNVDAPPLRGNSQFVIVCLCMCFGNAFIHGFYYACGVVFFVIKDRFRDDHHLLIAAPLIMLLMVGPIFSPVLAGVCQKYGCRIVSITGGLVSVLGILFTSFVENPFQNIISIGVVMSIGLTMMVVPLETAGNNHADTRRKEIVGHMVCACAAFVGLAVISLAILDDVSVHGWTRGFQILIAGAGIGTLVSVLYKPPDDTFSDEPEIKCSNHVSQPFWTYLGVSVWRNSFFRLWMLSDAFCYIGMFIWLLYSIIHGVECGMAEHSFFWFIPILSLSAVIAIIATTLFHEMYGICSVMLLPFWLSFGVVAAVVWTSLMESGAFILLAVVSGMAIGGLTVSFPFVTSDVLDKMNRIHGTSWSRVSRGVLAVLVLPGIVCLTTHLNSHRAAFYASSCLFGISLVFSLILAKWLQSQDGDQRRTEATHAYGNTLYDRIGESESAGNRVSGGVPRIRSKSCPIPVVLSKHVNTRRALSVVEETCTISKEHDGPVNSCPNISDYVEV